jgi:transposase-like protein
MKRYSEEEKAMWLEDWKRSGGSLRSYAKTNGLNPQTFNNWAKGTEKPPAQDFIEIKRMPEAAPVSVPEILIEKGDVKIHIPLAINRADLRAALEGLGWRL